MTLRANRHVLTATHADSGALTQLGVVIHRFDEPGTYQCRVFRADQLAGRCFVVVDPEVGTSDVTVDLAAVGDDGDQTYHVHPAGAVLFHVSQGSGGFHVVVSRPQENDEGFETVFDSRRLETDDVFVVRPVQPGRYTVSNADTSAEGELVVTPPKDGALFKPHTPISATIGASVDPERVETVAAQGVAYRVDRRARVTVAREADLDPGNGEGEGDEGRRPVRPRPRPGGSSAGRLDDRFTIINPATGERPDEMAVNAIESVGETTAERLATVGVESVADLARLNPASVARAIDGSPEQASRLVEMARLVTLGASSTSADLLTRLGETSRTIAGTDPEALTERLRTGIAERELPAPDGFDPTVSELGSLVANANRFGTTRRR